MRDFESIRTVATTLAERFNASVGGRSDFRLQTFDFRLQTSPYHRFAGCTVTQPSGNVLGDSSSASTVATPGARLRSKTAIRLSSSYFLYVSSAHRLPASRS